MFTIGHGARSSEELVDVRRFPGSRRHPQFDREAVATTVADAGIASVHAEALGGRQTGGERFSRIRVAPFRGDAKWMGSDRFQDALATALGDELGPWEPVGESRDGVLDLCGERVA